MARTDEATPERHTCRIGFQSGNELVINVETLEIRKQDNQVCSIKWTNGPGLLYMALSRIEYVIEDV